MDYLRNVYFKHFRMSKHTALVIHDYSEFDKATKGFIAISTHAVEIKASLIET